MEGGGVAFLTLGNVYFPFLLVFPPVVPSCLSASGLSVWLAHSLSLSLSLSFTPLVVSLLPVLRTS